MTVLTVVALAGFVGGAGLASCGGDADSISSETVTETTQTETTQTTETDPVPTDTTETVVRIEVRDGVPAGGIVRETVEKGERIVLVVESDVADEIHLHGYDLTRTVAAGGSTRIAFRATIPGRFEVELEERGVQIAELTVEP
ncbi:MAG: hypothetical protein H0U82_01080 [Actinobacteria bacterium]|nr:hypothetical protein [Actinomycetota bacterium]